MNPEELKKALEPIKTELEGKLNSVAKGEREYSDQVKSEITEKLGEIEKAYQSANGEVQKSFDQLSVQFKELKNQGMNTRKAHEMNLTQIIEKGIADNKDKFSNFANTHKGGFEIDTLKAVGTMTTPAWTNTNIVDNNYLPGILPDVYRNGRIRPLFPGGATTGNAVPFVAESGGEGAADVTGEGSAKNQIDKDLAVTNAPVRKITAYLKVSEEMLTDIPALSAYLGFSLQNMILDKEDQQLLYGAGTGNQLTGVTANASVQTAADLSSALETSAPNNYDCVVAAKAHLSSLNYRATNVLMNPVDVAAMALSKSSSNGQYLTPIFYDQNGPTIFGIPVYESTAVSEGDLIVMDGTRAAQIFQRAPLSVRFYDQNEDDAINNLVTVVAEERLALPIYYGDAIFFDTFADIITAMTP